MEVDLSRNKDKELLQIKTLMLSDGGANLSYLRFAISSNTHFLSLTGYRLVGFKVDDALISLQIHDF